jgi:branched-chain amino acid transport system ATP-binding protein
MPLLETRDISIAFGGLQALRDVTISVDEWEIVGLIGPNGAGKTTFFNCVTGFYRPDAGSVEFRGMDISLLPPHRRAGLGIGRTFQQVGLVRGMTVLENLVTAQHGRVGYDAVSGVLGFPGSVTEDRRLAATSMDILALMDLDHLVGEMVDDLAYGTLKKVELAAVLATDPDLLMLDEPSSGMGPQEAHELGEVLVRIRSELDITILMIEHHVPLVVGVCDYVYVLNFGMLLTSGSPREIQTHPEVIAAYLGEEAVAAS